MAYNVDWVTPVLARGPGPSHRSCSAWMPRLASPGQCSLALTGGIMPAGVEVRNRHQPDRRRPGVRRRSVAGR